MAASGFLDIFGVNQKNARPIGQFLTFWSAQNNKQDTAAGGFLEIFGDD